MSIMTTLIVTLGQSIGSTILKLWLPGNSVSLQAGLTFMELVAELTPNVLEQRRARRQFEQIGEQVGAYLSETIEAEFHNLDDDTITSIIQTVSEVLTNTSITTDILIKGNLQERTLKKYFVEKNPTLTVHYGEDELALFELLMEESCHFVLQTASSFPGFKEKSVSEILMREDALLDVSKTILEEIVRMKPAQSEVRSSSARYETRYRRSIVRELDNVELFGLNASSLGRRQNLSVAYVALEVEETGKFPGTPDNESVSGENAIVSITKKLGSLRRRSARGKRLLFIGDAGSGKTTLLKWIAVRSALKDFPEEISFLNECIPFFLRLRSFEDGQLPNPDEFAQQIAPLFEATKPELWEHQLLDSGNAIVLIDGLDEVTESQRPRVARWLIALMEEFKDAIFLITSRPHAVEFERADLVLAMDFETVFVQSMDLYSIYLFIDHWHQAVANNTNILEEREKLFALGRELKKQILRSKPLLYLAETPLLCAMICAINQKTNAHVPSERTELYEAGIRMLLEGRERERDINLQEYPDLTLGQKRVLIQYLAFWMMQNGLTETTVDNVDARFKYRLEYIDSDLSKESESVRRYFVERTGLLREPSPGKIDFSHKTFQEYLAALEVVNEDGLGVLLNHASDVSWRQVIILASGRMGTKKATELIDILLQKGDSGGNSSPLFYLLAVECADIAIGIEPQIAERVDQRVSALLPPRSMGEAKILAKVGDIIISRLSNPQPMRSREAAASARTLFLIDSEASVRALANFATDNRVAVRNELVSGGRHLLTQSEYYFEYIVPLLNLSFDEIISNESLHDARVLSRQPEAFFEHIEKLVIIDFHNPKQNTISLRSSQLSVPIRDLETIVDKLPHLQHIKSLEIRLINDNAVERDFNQLPVFENLQSLRVINFSGRAIVNLPNITSELSSIELASNQSIDVQSLSPNLKVAKELFLQVTPDDLQSILGLAVSAEEVQIMSNGDGVIAPISPNLTTLYIDAGNANLQLKLGNLPKLKSIQTYGNVLFGIESDCALPSVSTIKGTGPLSNINDLLRKVHNIHTLELDNMAGGDIDIVSLKHLKNLSVSDHILPRSLWSRNLPNRGRRLERQPRSRDRRTFPYNLNHSKRLRNLRIRIKNCASIEILCLNTRHDLKLDLVSQLPLLELLTIRSGNDVLDHLNFYLFPKIEILQYCGPVRETTIPRFQELKSLRQLVLLDTGNHFENSIVNYPLPDMTIIGPIKSLPEMTSYGNRTNFFYTSSSRAMFSGSHISLRRFLLHEGSFIFDHANTIRELMWQPNRSLGARLARIIKRRNNA